MHLQRNIEAHSCNHSCSGKAISKIHSECVCGCMQRDIRMRHLVWPANLYNIYPHYLINGATFETNLFS